MDAGVSDCGLYVVFDYKGPYQLSSAAGGPRERFGKYSEQRYRQQFDRTFNFLDFNKELIHQHSSGKLVIAIDPGFIAKAGKKHLV